MGEEDEQGEEEMEQERDSHHQPPPATEVTSHDNQSSATSDISQRLGDRPRRPIRQNYPSWVGNQQRSFNGLTHTAGSNIQFGSVAHQFAMEAWAEFKLTTTDVSRLGNMIVAGHSRIVQE